MIAAHARRDTRRTTGAQLGSAGAIATGTRCREVLLTDRDSRAGDEPPGDVPETDRLRFRPWAQHDADLARSLWGDAEVMRYLHVAGPYTDAQVQERLDKEAATVRTHGFQYWPMFLADGGEFAGCAGLKVCPYEGTPEAPELELGFHLMPTMWGRGLATEAAIGVARHAFDRFGVARVYAGHHPDNDASAAVLKKVGFRYHRHVFFQPTGTDHPLYVLERRP